LRLLLEQVSQRAAAHVFQHEVVVIVFLDRRRDFDDVGVVELAERFAFARNPFDQLGMVGDDLRSEQLDGYSLVCLGVQAPVHLAHAALTDCIAELEPIRDNLRPIHPVSLLSRHARSRKGACDAVMAMCRRKQIGLLRSRRRLPQVCNWRALTPLMDSLAPIKGKSQDRSGW